MGVRLGFPKRTPTAGVLYRTDVPDSCRLPVCLLSDAGVAAASPSPIDELTDEIAEHVRLLVERRRRRPPTPAQHEHINFHGTYNLDAESGLPCQGHRPLRSPAP